MKKMFLFTVLFVLAGTFSLVAKNYSEKEIRVSGFDSNKPLKKMTTISVSYPESPDVWYLEEAYKGENIDSFLKRVNSPVYHRPPSVEKGPYLSLKELEDSLTMAEMKLLGEEKVKDESIVSDASQEEKMFNRYCKLLVLFFAILIAIFILFGRVPLIWGTKNKK